MGALGTTFRAGAAAVFIWMSCGAAPAAAQSIDTLETTFKDWMTQYKLRSGVLAVSHQKRLVLSKGYGGTDANAGLLLASLSKAITAVCVATLVDAGKLSFDTRIGAALSDFFRRNGEPRDPRVKTITIAQLISHRSGFDRTNGDAGSGGNLSGLLEIVRASDTALEQLLSRGFRQPLGNPPGEKYVYTNMSYLILGAVIQEASGKNYEPYCRDAVMQPLGIVGAGLDPDWRIISSYGGWRLSGPQYLRFMEAFASDSAVLGPKSKAFMADGDGKWTNERKTIYYALGVLTRPMEGGGYNLWHAGEWRYDLRNTVNGRLSENLGTYAVRQAKGTSWFAQYRPNPGDKAESELDRAMGRAIGAIKTWPSEDLYAGGTK